MCVQGYACSRYSEMLAFRSTQVNNNELVSLHFSCIYLDFDQKVGHGAVFLMFAKEIRVFPSCNIKCIQFKEVDTLTMCVLNEVFNYITLTGIVHVTCNLASVFKYCFSDPLKPQAGMRIMHTCVRL